MGERVHLPIATDRATEGHEGDGMLTVSSDGRPKGPPMGLPDPWRDTARAPERAVSCVMADSLYVKANGEMPCWCDEGEDIILEQLTVERLMDPSFDVLNQPRIQRIRRSFHHDERYPFAVCGRCAMVQPDAPRVEATTRAAIDILHVEPSWLCNLDCPLCIPKAQRKTIKDPPWNLEPTLWVALVHNLKIHGVERVRVLDLEGRGDPMMHPHLAHLCKVFHLVFPETMIQVTTNGNFPFPPELMESGMTHLRVSADGARDESYRTYRRDGELSKVLAFLRDAVESRARTGRDVFIEWKYILFEWNDTDEEMLEAYAIAADLGVKLSFCLTPWAGKSLRFDGENLARKLEALMPTARSHPTRHVELGLDRSSEHEGS